MNKIFVAYWSGTGNTEKMAEAVAEGIRESGSEAECRGISATSVDEALRYDAVALGCPSMGAEVLEEGEMEPFVEEFCQKANGKKVGLFGSYGWGDGEWMRNWAVRMRDCGCALLNDGLIAHETPNDGVIAECKSFGKALADFAK